MTKQELIEKLKENLPVEYQDQVDDFVSYLLVVGQGELFSLIDMAIGHQFGTLRKNIIKTLSSQQVLEDMTERNDLWAARLQLRAQKKAEFIEWLKGLLKALLVIGVENILT